MPSLRIYNLFISHTWRYNKDYYNLEKLLFSAPYFNWRNYSVPTHDPLIKKDTYAGVAKLTKLLEYRKPPVKCLWEDRNFPYLFIPSGARF
jgi:hypothetical protein